MELFLKPKFLLISGIIIIAVVISAYLLKGDKPTNTAKPSKTAEYRWETGAYSYKYSAVTTVGVDMDTKTSSSPIRIDGTLQMQIFSVDNGIIKAGFTLHPVTVSNGTTSDKTLERLYSSLILTDITEEGYFENIRFQPGISSTEKKALTGLLKSIEAVIRSGEKYQIEQTSPNGSYTAEYRYDGERYGKFIEGYTPQNSEISIKVLNYKCNFKPSDDSVWLDTLFLTEKLIFSSGGKSMLTSESDISLQRLSLSNAATDIPKSYEQAVKKVQKPRIIEQVQVTVESDFDNLLNSLKTEKNRAGSLALRQYLTANPEKTLEIPDIIKRGNLNDSQNREIINILGLIGTPAGQEALVSISSDKSQSEDSRFRAAMSFSSISAPLTKETTDYLFSRAGDIGSVDSEDAGTELLAIGAIVQNLKEDYPDDAEQLANRLASELSSTSGKAQKLMLKSLGNTAMPEYIDTISSYLSGGDSKTRETAAQSLKFINTPEAVKALTSSLETETEKTVRSSMANSLSKMDVSGENLKKINNYAVTENDIDTRRALIDVLSKHSDDANSVNTLKNMLKTEKSKTNMEKIIKAIGDK